MTGCLAERAGEELAEAMPEVDLVAGFGVPVQLSTTCRVVRVGAGVGEAAVGRAAFDLLELARPAATPRGPT